MMIHTVLIGILLLSPSTVRAQDRLYDYVKQTVEWEQAHQDAEVAVEEYIEHVVHSPLIRLRPEDVDDILLESLSLSCDPATDDPVDVGRCTEHLDTVTELTKREALIRGQIREMQVIASGHEAVIRNRPEAIARKLPAILRIWQSDADLLATPSSVEEGDEPDIDEQIEDILLRLEQALRGLIRTVQRGDSLPEEDREHFVAAVFRYRHGIPEVEPCDEARTGKGDGTELQYLEARWCSIEDLLLELSAASVGLGLDDETRVVLREIEDLDVDIWVQDVQAGFAWRENWQPVLPSLNCSTSTHSFKQSEETCKKKNAGEIKGAILGGTYPDELDDVSPLEGICADPLHKNGYLCNGPLSDRCPDPGEETDEEGKVQLARCARAALKGVNRWTESGPNICLEGGWRMESHPPTAEDTPEQDFLQNYDDNEDNDFLPHRCSKCVVDLYCSKNGECDEGGQSYPKMKDGVIATCIGTKLGALTEAVIMHEIVHAQQQCNSPPGQSLLSQIGTRGGPGCCAMEYQANLPKCKMLAQDGVLAGVGYSIETCAAAFTNVSCSVQPGDELCTDLSPGLTSKDILESIKKYANDHAEELGLITDCETAIANLDERSQMMKNSLPQVCTPECQSLHTNTIGNLLCTFGQCVEQSMEEHRLTPGRMSLTTEGQAYPWDSAIEMISNNEAKQDAFALSGTPDIIAVPLPPYRPRYLIGKLDDFFCRMNALPKRTPPVLCQYDPQRQGAAGRQSAVGTPLKFFVSFLEQSGVTASLSDTMRSAAPGIGARIASRYHAQYLQTALRPLNELVKTANTLLKELAETDFPEQMCPYDFERP